MVHVAAQVSPRGAGLLVLALLVVKALLSWVRGLLGMATNVVDHAVVAIEPSRDPSRSLSVADLRDVIFQRDDPLDFSPPPLHHMASVCKLYEAVVDPVFDGLERVPTDAPVLFICNHALYAIEFPLLLARVYRDKDVFIRGCGDFVHKYMPYWPLFRYMGAFDGSRDHCERLMSAKQPVLIFPGGAREVLKRRTDEKYGLFWKERLGFARLAIQFGYTIVPVATVGTEDMVDILVDIPLQSIFRREMYLPIIKPPDPQRLQRIYFKFGDPIRADQFGSDPTDDKAARALRDTVQAQVQQSIEELQQRQASDPARLRPVTSIVRNIIKSYT